MCNPSGRNLDDFDVHGNVGSDDPVKLDMTNVATYRSLGELLADESIDLIDITTPIFLHHEQAPPPSRGKHVLCEKPVARTSAQAGNRRCCRDRPRIFMPAMCPCFWPEWKWQRTP